MPGSDTTKVNTVNISGKGVDQNTYDAIVIGSGISGGWAAKELCDHGLKTLVLERGRDVKHVKDYPTTSTNLWDFQHRGQMPIKKTQENPIVSRCYAYGESTDHFFVKDQEHPYVQEKTVRLDQGIPGRWQVASLGKGHTALEQV